MKSNGENLVFFFNFISMVFDINHWHVRNGIAGDLLFFK